MVSHLGALETWRCDACGNEEVRHVYFIEAPALSPNLEPILEVFVRWIGKPGAEQISELHKSFPRLRKMAAVDILKAARGSGRLAVGRFRESELAPLRPRLEALGIAVETAAL
jgi:hypothetical protein